MLIRAGIGLAAGVVAGGLGLAFLPHLEPNAVRPRAAVEKPQFVESAALPKPTASAASRAASAVAVAAETGGSGKGTTSPDAEPLPKPSPKPTSAAAALTKTSPIAVASLDPPKLGAVATSNERSVTFADEPAPAPKSTPASPRPAANPQSPGADKMAGGVASADLSVQGLIAVAKGDLSSARIYLSRAAELGEPRAWVALADSYDPAILAKLGVVGAPGDMQRAKDYLSKAAAAGIVVAKDRMAALEQNVH